MNPRVRLLAGVGTALGLLALGLCQWLFECDRLRKPAEPTAPHPFTSVRAKAPDPGSDAPPVSAATAAAQRDAHWPDVAPAALAAWAQTDSEPVAVAAAPLPVPTPAPPVEPPSPSPPPVQAPAFSYKLIGVLQDGAQRTALLDGPRNSLAVRAGDVIDGQWRVERVDADALALLWLPAQTALRTGYPRS